MSHSLVVADVPFGTLTPVLIELDEHRAEFRRSSKSAGTRRAYASCLKSFDVWCRQHGLRSLPASEQTVARFIAAQCLAGLKVSTIETKLAAIRYMHVKEGHLTPTVHRLVVEEMEGIRRTYGTAPNKKKAATANLVKAMLSHIKPDTLKGQRDKALLLLGFAGALRRSELVGLNFDDLEFGDNGITLTIRRSKTDQHGAGHIIGIPSGEWLRPVEAMQAWLDASGIVEGPVFRPVEKGGRLQPGRLSGKTVAILVKYYAKAAGLEVADFAGHSLRAGYITTAAENGVAEGSIMDQSRHTDARTVRGYIRKVDLFRNHSGASFL